MKVRLVIPLTILLFFGYPACRCPDFSLLTGVQRFLFYDSQKHRLAEGGEFAGDTLHIQLWMSVETFTDAGGWGTMATADAYHFSCFPPRANAIQSIDFYSDRDFNDVPAGQSLSAKLWNTYYAVTAEEMPVAFDIDFEYDYDLWFQFLEKPVEPEHTFSVHIVDNAGNVFVHQARKLIWL